MAWTQSLRSAVAQEIVALDGKALLIGLAGSRLIRKPLQTSQK
jgi:hypothetical protein